MSQIVELRLRVDTDEPLSMPHVGEGVALTLRNFGLTDGNGHRLIDPPGARDVRFLGGYVTRFDPPESVTIRRSSYRGDQGFTVTDGRSRIFTTTRDSADRIRQRLLNGEDTRSEDFIGTVAP